MRAWKHHVSEHFHSDPTLLGPGNGAGKGATIFLDFDKMVDYLQKDGREWHIAELTVSIEDLWFNFGCDWMATVLIDVDSERGFFPLHEQIPDNYTVTRHVR